MEKKKSNILLLFFILLILFIIIASLCFWGWYKYHLQNGRIQTGVFIKGIDVSNLTKEEAKSKIQKYLDEVMSDYVIFKYNDYEYNIEVSQINAYFDVDSAVNYAYSIGRKNNLKNDLNEFVSVSLNKVDIEPVLIYDEKALDDYIEFLRSFSSRSS